MADEKCKNCGHKIENYLGWRHIKGSERMCLAGRTGMYCRCTSAQPQEADKMPIDKGKIELVNEEGQFLGYMCKYCAKSVYCNRANSASGAMSNHIIHKHLEESRS